MKTLLVVLMLLVSLVGDGASVAIAQTDLPTILPGWDLDTTGTNLSDADRQAVREVWSLWRDYLAARIKGNQRPDLWVSSERAQWPEYDLTAFQAYQSFTRTSVTVLSIRPPHPATRDTMVIRTLFARTSTDSATSVQSVRPISLTRVYAVRTPFGWRLSNALLHLTSSWKRARHGRINFLYAPGSRASPERQRAAGRFVASLARAFQLEPPRQVLYVVAPSGEEAYRAFGFDYAVIGSLTAGKTYVENKIVLAGDARLGEAYLHELAHLVLAPIAPPESIPRMINEGLAIWSGGTLGQSYAEARRGYAALLRQYPEITLDGEVNGSVRGDSRIAGALLCELVFRMGGTSAIRTLLANLRQLDLRRAVERTTGKPWIEIAERWRATAMLPPNHGLLATPQTHMVGRVGLRQRGHL